MSKSFTDEQKASIALGIVPEGATISWIHFIATEEGVHGDETFVTKYTYRNGHWTYLTYLTKFDNSVRTVVHSFHQKLTEKFLLQPGGD